MKALTIYQPWASLIALGAKKIETRSWPTSYRGPLAIHASKAIRTEFMNLAWQDPFYSALKPLHGNVGGSRSIKYPLGCVIAIVQLVDCIEIRPDNVPTGPERYFGDYTRGRFMWVLRDVKRLKKPIPARGLQRLWEWDAPEDIANYLTEVEVDVHKDRVG